MGSGHYEVTDVLLPIGSYNWMPNNELLCESQTGWFVCDPWVIRWMI